MQSVGGVESSESGELIGDSNDHFLKPHEDQFGF